MRYWLNRGDGAVLGPYSVEELTQHVATGHVQVATAMLCAEGTTQWIPAGSVLGGVPFAPPTQPVPGAEGPRYANFGMRLCAALVDGVLLWMVGLVIAAIVGGVVTAALKGRGSSQKDLQMIEAVSMSVGSVINFCIGILYSTVLESSSKQGTLGKMLLGIKVVNESGNRISFGQALGRHFGKILSGCLLLVGYLMMLWDPKSQCLHDKMAGTYVVRK